MKKFQNLFLLVATVAFFSQDANALFCGKKCRAKKQEAKAHLEAGGNCTDLSGGAKRKCKRQARKLVRHECSALSGKAKIKCKRDLKAKHGAYGFIGAKKANAQGKANWELFEQRKAELDAQLESGQITAAQHQEMLKFAKRQRRIESNRIGKVKTIKTVAAVGIAAAGAAAVVATGGAAAVGLMGAKGVAAGAAAGAGAGLAVGAGVGAIGANGASRNLQKMDAGYQAKMAQIHGQNGVVGQVGTGTGFTDPVFGGNVPGGVRGPASESGCKSLPPGSCQRKMCRCSVGVRRASKGLPIINHTNKKGGPTINKICGQHAHLGFQGAWEALKRMRPNGAGRCQ